MKSYLIPIILFLYIPTKSYAQDYQKEREEAKKEIKVLKESNSSVEWNRKEQLIVAKPLASALKFELEAALIVVKELSTHISYEDFDVLSDYKKGYFLSYLKKDIESRNYGSLYSDTDKKPLDFDLFMESISTKKWKNKELKEVTAKSIRIGKIDKKYCKLATKEISKHISYTNFKGLSNYQQANLQDKMGKYIVESYGY